jgi:hypothetical protein
MKMNTDKSARRFKNRVAPEGDCLLECKPGDDADFVLASDYDALQAAFQAATAERDALREALTMLYDKFEDGTDCYEDPEDYTGYLGKAIKLSTEEEEAVLALIPTERAALAGVSRG